MTATDGDQRLGDDLRSALGRRHRVAAAGMVAPDGIRVTSIGTTVRHRFEIGSISKGITGLLYADAVDRGEVRPDTVLGDALPLGDTPVAGVTLGALAVHRSGLPRMLPTGRRADIARATWRLYRHGANPYSEDVAELVRRARLATPGPSRPRYSNLGFEMLGHAVAAAAGVPYADLVRRRIREPLGLRSLYVPSQPADLGTEDLRGTTRHGRPRDPWVGDGIGPAGGIRASVEDMTRLVAALLSGAAPGVRALDPMERFRGGMRIGAGWITVDMRGRTITWHNGGTGGFRSWLGIDRAAAVGVVVMTATARSVDGAGWHLLRPGERSRGSRLS